MKYVNVLVAILFIAVYYSVKIPPSQTFNLWIVSFAIPLVLIVNIILLIVYGVLKRISFVFYLIALYVGFHFILSTIGIKSLFKKKPEASPLSFTVLSYNVSGLKKPRGIDMSSFSAKQDKDSITYKLKQWILNCDADVQCYQEFFDYPQNEYLNVVNAIEKKGLHYYFSSTGNDETSGTGVLLVSKFPILQYGDILVSENGYNRVAFADIKIKKDTIRIINLHLESMEMKKHNPVYTEDPGVQKQQLKIVLRKLKDGVFERSKQIKEVVATIDSSNYPVICAGDFNELPYSYTYNLLNKKMNNAFEEGGTGFGFTYNGNTINFLRIDNQFFSDDIEVINFTVLKDIDYSDHFPLLGTYQLPVPQ